MDNVAAVLRLLDSLRRLSGGADADLLSWAPKTQLQCLELGAPVEIMFQSLAEPKTRWSASLMSRWSCWTRPTARWRREAPWPATAQQFMYFETGQGSEFTYGKHHGIDMSTSEALCYGRPAATTRSWSTMSPASSVRRRTLTDNFEMII